MSLLSELRRRNVHRMVVLYVIGAWLVVQVADTAFPGWGIPDSSIRYVFIAAILGLPIALIFSWRFDITIKGIKRTPAVHEEATGVPMKTTDHVLLVGLSAVAIAMVAVLTQEIIDTRGDVTFPPIAGELDAPAKSVAVLPFVNMSADENNAYFSDGLADTMLHMLAQVPNLRVPARTSSFQFRNFEGDISEVGRRLNVSAVLEGSVQRYGDKVRVIAQLIDVSDGFHLWSRTFDRDFKDIFAIQDDIAREVVAALKVSMSDQTLERLDYGGTDNTDAYTEYLLAIDSMNPWTSQSVKKAMPHLQKAIEIDPNYALAHAMLGSLYFDRPDDMGLSQAIAAAKKAANRALEIAPDLPEALAVLGGAERWYGDKDLGKQLLRKAVEVGPNNILALSAYATHLLFELRPAESLAITRRIIRLNPLDESGYSWTISNLWNQGKLSEALELALRFREVRPDSPSAIGWLAECHSTMGEYAASIRLSHEAFALDPGNTDRLAQIGARYLLVDMVEEARYWFDREAESDPEGLDSTWGTILLNYYLQQNEEESFRLARELLIEHPNWIGAQRIVLTEWGAKLGQHDVVVEFLDNLYPRLLDGPLDDADHQWRSSYYSALALLQSGNIKRGAPLMKAFLEYRDREEEVYAVEWHSIAGRLALGDTEAAMTKLKQFRSTMFLKQDISVQTMYKHSELFDPIRDEPEFIALLKEYRDNAAEQRRLVQADEAK